MPITKNDLINDTAEHLRAKHDTVKTVVEQFFSVVKEAMEEGRSLEIRGFGTFSPKVRNSRYARNLKTGELIPLASHKDVSFKFSSSIKDEMIGSKLQPGLPKQEAKPNLPVQAHELAKTN